MRALSRQPYLLPAGAASGHVSAIGALLVGWMIASRTAQPAARPAGGAVAALVLCGELLGAKVTYSHPPMLACPGSSSSVSADCSPGADASNPPAAPCVACALPCKKCCRLISLPLLRRFRAAAADDAEALASPPVVVAAAGTIAADGGAHGDLGGFAVTPRREIPFELDAEVDE